MLQTSTIWNVMQDHVPKKQWVPIDRIFAIIESHCVLDKEDLKIHVRAPKNPHWRTSVRRVLDVKKKSGEILGRRRDEA